MNGTLDGDEVRLGANARQQFHDARGYGRPLSGNAIACSKVEAAHLLFRGDIDSVDGMGFPAFFASASDERGFGVRFLVYADLRSRGFYCSPADVAREEGWVGPADAAGADFVVYPRGKGPGDGVVEHRVTVVGERETLPVDALDGRALAVVDEESEITYLDTERRTVEGSTETDLPTAVSAVVLADRVVCWDPPADLYGTAFYGQPLAGRDGDRDAIQLSLLEAAHLARDDVLAVPGGYDAVVERGRAVEGERFDRRLRAYTYLREHGVVPKTGFKFGADFRTYADVESVEDLGHSELLVRVLSADHVFSPRDLALDVRLAHGVRKTMVYGVVDDEDAAGPEWVAVERLTP